MQQFAVGDVVYRRCKNKVVNNPNPFKDLELADVSLNRATINGAVISDPEDVLYNILAETEADAVHKEAVLGLKIMEVDEAKATYFKCLPEKEETTSEGELRKHYICLELLHDCIPCNYAHSVIAVYYNDKLLTPENYEQELGKKKGKAKELRNEARVEIAAMITYREIWIDRPAAN